MEGRERDKKRGILPSIGSTGEDPMRAAVSFRKGIPAARISREGGEGETMGERGASDAKRAQT